MDDLSVVRRAFLRLPRRLRSRLLSAIGKRAPWDPRFDHRSPPSALGLVMAAPDFVGVGIQKAGTSWWFDLILSHPRVYSHAGLHKERHYFSQYFDHAFTESDRITYHRWFPRPQGMLTGEWTPDYLHQPWVAPLLQQAAPDTRIIVMLRDPVERYRSGLAHDDRRGRRGADVAALAFSRGFYAEGLHQYRELFGIENVLVLQYEACVRDPQAGLARTMDHLGVEPILVQGATNVRNASPHKPRLASELQRVLIDRYSSDVLAVVRDHPEVDLALWPNFAHLA